jgi:Xaa-Pro dipeptidase
MPTRRLAAVQDEMRSRNLDALLVYSQKRGHVAFLSGYRPNYHTNSAFMLLPREGDPTLFIKFGFDMPRARNLSWVQDIRPGHSENAVCLLHEFSEIVQEKGLQSGRLGWVASDDWVDEMSASLYGALGSALPKATIEPASDLVNRLRLYKDPDEIKVLRRSAEIADIASNALQRAIQPGVEDFVAAGEATGAATAAGAERCDVLLSLDPAHHSLPVSHQRFQHGKSISMELTIQHDGYWVQVCRSFCLGRPNSLQKRVFTASRDAYRASVDAAGPGVRASAVAQAAIDVVDKAGFQGCIKYGLGHGVGLDLPEPWSIDLSVDSELVDQMCLVLHVGVWTEGASAFTGGPIIVNGTNPLVLDQPQQEQIEI